MTTRSGGGGRGTSPGAADAKMVCCLAQCQSTVEVGGEVDSLLLYGGYLFVGLHTKGQEGIIKLWNLTSGTYQQLTGHKVSTQKW